MAKTRIRAPGNRSSGGRPRKDGPRTAGGRLKVEPNARVVAERAALGAALGVGEAGARMGPIRLAYSRGWLSMAHMVVADIYIDAYSHAGLGGLGFSAQRDPGIEAGAADELRIDWSTLDNAQVMALGWNAFSAKEVAAIWDSAFRPQGQYLGKVSALRKWKAMSASMSPAERHEVDRVVLLDSWPQWIIQRNAGRLNTSWEAKRDLLLSGLSKMGRAVKALKDVPVNDNGRGGQDAGAA